MSAARTDWESPDRHMALCYRNTNTQYIISQGPQAERILDSGLLSMLRGTSSLGRIGRKVCLEFPPCMQRTGGDCTEKIPTRKNLQRKFPGMQLARRLNDVKLDVSAYLSYCQVAIAAPWGGEGEGHSCRPGCVPRRQMSSTSNLGVSAVAQPSH